MVRLHKGVTEEDLEVLPPLIIAVRAKDDCRGTTNDTTSVETCTSRCPVSANLSACRPSLGSPQPHAVGFASLHPPAIHPRTHVPSGGGGGGSGSSGDGVGAGAGTGAGAGDGDGDSDGDGAALALALALVPVLALALVPLPLPLPVLVLILARACTRAH